MHSVGKSEKVLPWSKDDLKKKDSESPFHPVQAQQITIQRANMRNKRKRREGRHGREDLSRDDLLFLLSILEGELQVG